MVELLDACLERARATQPSLGAFASLDEEGAELLDRELAERRGAAAVVVATHDPARVEQLASARLALAA